ncbi:MAG: type II secretion system protein [Candidatus Paceibacterota bacterium]|jgi:prepilin-type N-terminal cleavage/methylation domain-containing protein
MKYLNFSKNKGFTLLELMVVITIATAVITSLVFQQNKWNDSLTVNSQAYELALMIRQSQIYSLGVREYVGGTGDKFNIGYGVYFSQSNLNGYVFFADKNGNQKYDAGESIETKTFTRGVTIKDVCGEDTNGCFPGSGPLTSVSISFFRPEIKANMSLLNAGGGSTGDPPVTIRLQSVGGKYSSVKVDSNGQVSIIQ